MSAGHWRVVGVGLALAAFVFTAGVWCGRPAPRVETAARAAGPADVDALLARSAAAWGVPGAAVVVVRDGRVWHLSAYGVRAAGRPEPVTPDTLFPVASCTKAFASAALAALVADGVAGWDDPVRKHLPEFRLADPIADQGVTLRDLLCHRTGVGSHDILWYRGGFAQPELVRRLGHVGPEYPFRSGYAYQSSMYTALGLACERAAGGPWGDLVRRRLLEPLRMSDTVTAVRDAAARADRATGHLAGPRPIDWYDPGDADAAGSVCSTARDLGNWLLFQLGEGSFEGRQVVDAAALRETRRPQVVLPWDDFHRAVNPESVQACYALGWVVQDYRGRRLEHHTGAIDGFRAHVGLLPGQNAGWAVLANLHHTRMNLAVNFRLADLLLGEPPRDWDALVRDAMERHGGREPTPAAPAGEPRAGRYEDAAYGTLEVVRDGEAWRLRLGGRDYALTVRAGGRVTLADPVLGAVPVGFAERAVRVYGATFVLSEPRP